MKSFEIGSAPGTPIQSVFNMTLPNTSPQVVPINIDMTVDASVEVDLSPLVQNGNIEFVSGAWIDNSQNANILTFRVDGTKQLLRVPAYSQGYFPMLSPNMPKFIVSSPVAPGVIIPVLFYNIPLLPYQWFANVAGGTPVTGDWLTDAELRATAVNVLIAGQSMTDRSIANLSGASEVLMAANANRNFLFIQNIAGNNMGVNLVGGAAAIGTAGTITLVPGASLTFDSNCPTGAINIIGTANDDVTAMEG